MRTYIYMSVWMSEVVVVEEGVMVMAVLTVVAVEEN